MNHMVFVIGSPRSGTTMLGDILDNHPLVANWYEPYFVQDRYFRQSKDDIRSVSDATPEVSAFLRAEFERYGRARRVLTVVDKSPRNSFKVPFLRTVFPQSKFIHILRDGRDATLSIYRQWLHRQGMLGAPPLSTLSRMVRVGKTVKTMLLDKQPLWRHKLQAVHFEMGSLLNLNPQTYQHRIRWKGKIGWGPRFQDWNQYYPEADPLEFSSRQWLTSVQAVQNASREIPEGNYLEIRYEDFTSAPENIMGRIIDFLELPASDFVTQALANIRADNSRKWQRGFSPQQLKIIGPIIGDELIRLRYAFDNGWF